MCLIEYQSWIDCIDIYRWDTFVLFHLYGNKGVSLPLWPIRPRWFHTYSPCAEPLGDGHEGMWARFGSQGSIALNWHSRYSGTRYSGTWLYMAHYYVFSWLMSETYFVSLILAYLFEYIKAITRAVGRIETWCFCFIYITLTYHVSNNPLWAIFFIRKRKNVSTIHIIPSHWHGTGTWNPSSCRARTCLFYIANVVGAIVLATQGARASSTMIFTLLNRDNSIAARSRLTLYVLIFSEETWTCISI